MVKTSGNTSNLMPSRRVHLDKEDIKKKQTNLQNFKKYIDSDIKENFKKELEELKNRNNKLMTKPNGYCDMPFGSTSSSGSSSRRSGGSGSRRSSRSRTCSGRSGNDNKDNEKSRCEKKDMKYKISSKPLRDTNMLNISFNDIDKKISNLQNYLKNTKK